MIMEKTARIKESTLHERLLPQTSFSINRPRWTCYSRFRKHFNFLCVHAASSDNEENPQRHNQGHKMMQGRHVITELDVQKIIKTETGRGRLQEMFKRLEGTRELGPEMTLVTSVTTQVTTVLFTLAAYLGAKQAKMTYREKNQVAVYKTPFIAHRKINDSALRGALRHGLIYGGRGFLLIGSIMLISQSIATYRNKSSPFEYGIAAAITVGVWRSFLGLRGLVSGTIIGGGMGFGTGLCIYGLMHLMGETQEQRHYWHIHRRLEIQREIAQEIQ